MTMETPVIDGYSLWNRPAIGVAPWKLSAKLTEFHHCSAPQSCPTACRHSLVLKRMTSWVVWLNCSSLFRFNHLWPTDVHICSNMFIYVQICSYMFKYVHICSNMFIYVQICSYMFTYMSIFSIVERLYETVWRISLVNSPPWDHHQSVHLEDRASSAPWISWIVMIQTDQIDQIPQNTTGLFLHSKDTPKKKKTKNDQEFTRSIAPKAGRLMKFSPKKAPRAPLSFWMQKVWGATSQPRLKSSLWIPVWMFQDRGDL